MSAGVCQFCDQDDFLQPRCRKGLDPEAMALATAAPGRNPKIGWLWRIPCTTASHDREYFPDLVEQKGQLGENIRDALTRKAVCGEYREEA